MRGYFTPLSGGIDSCTTAVIVFSMCRLVTDAARRGGLSIAFMSFCLLTFRR
jgi:NAD+ synthase (glutamine-hydrolysing)